MSRTLYVYVGTKSEMKINAIGDILRANLPSDADLHIIGVEVKSEVPHTPFDDQTYEGAKNRAYATSVLYKNKGDLFLGLESGIVSRNSLFFEECWCSILDKEGKEYVGISSGFAIPKKIQMQMEKGETHIDIMNKHSKLLDIDSKDTWAIYSKNRIRRIESIKEAARNALLSYLSSEG